MLKGQTDLPFECGLLREVVQMAKGHNVLVLLTISRGFYYDTSHYAQLVCKGIQVLILLDGTES